MDKATPAATTAPPACLGTDWFDPLEDAVRGQMSAFIERLLEEELEAALGRGRYERGVARRHRNGARPTWVRCALDTFWPAFGVAK